MRQHRPPQQSAVYDEPQLGPETEVYGEWLLALEAGTLTTKVPGEPGYAECEELATPAMLRHHIDRLGLWPRPKDHSPLFTPTPRPFKVVHYREPRRRTPTGPSGGTINWREEDVAEVLVGVADFIRVCCDRYGSLTAAKEAGFTRTLQQHITFHFHDLLEGARRYQRGGSGDDGQGVEAPRPTSFDEQLDAPTRRTRRLLHDEEPDPNEQEPYWIREAPLARDEEEAEADVDDEVAQEESPPLDEDPATQQADEEDDGGPDVEDVEEEEPHLPPSGKLTKPRERWWPPLPASVTSDFYTPLDERLDGQRGLSLLTPEERLVWWLRQRGHTLTEIAAHTGHRAHRTISKRLDTLTGKLTRAIRRGEHPSGDLPLLTGLQCELCSVGKHAPNPEEPLGGAPRASRPGCAKACQCWCRETQVGMPAAVSIPSSWPRESGIRTSRRTVTFPIGPPTTRPDTL